MTRHLSLAALVFGLVSTASLAVATGLSKAESSVAPSMRFVELQRVEITAKRLAPER